MQKLAGIWMNDQKKAYVVENCDGEATLAV